MISDLISQDEDDEEKEILDQYKGEINAMDSQMQESSSSLA